MKAFILSLIQNSELNLNFTEVGLTEKDIQYWFLLTCIRAKNILNLFYEYSHSHSLPSPMIQFLIFLSKPGAYIPGYFMNDLEKNYLYEIDINDSLGYSDVKTKIAMLGFFCFEKILI